MKKHLAVMLVCATAVALARCAVLYQTGAKYEAALQETTGALDGVRSENAALKDEIAAAQKTLADLQKAREERQAAREAEAREERAAAREAQEQKERELQKQQEAGEVDTPTPPASGENGNQNTTSRPSGGGMEEMFGKPPEMVEHEW